jgi:hypothetical protein
VRELDEPDLDDLAVGAAILGTGGGGNPYIGKLLARETIRDHGPVTVVEPSEVPDDALVVQSAMMGAPTVMVEKIPSGEELLRAFEALQGALGREITHVVPAEIGGLNSMMPLIVAARTHLPLVDADGMGRAFPEVQMVTPTIYGISVTPMALVDEKGNAALIETIDNRWTERFARALTVEMGCTALVAECSMSGAELKETMVAGTLTLAQELGRLVRTARERHESPIDAVVQRLGGLVLFRGKLADVRRHTVAGFARGEAQIRGTGGDTGATLTLRFQNEHLYAERDGEVLITAPDLIIVLDAETGEPITTEDMRYGFRVVVIGAPCDLRWRTAGGLELVGPRCFGYDVDYVPVEQRAAGTRT